MADDTIDPRIIQQTEKEFRTLSKDTAKYRRILSSTIETIAKGSRTRKIQNEIIKEYIKGLKEKLKEEKGETKASKDRIKLIKQEIKQTEKLSLKLGIFGKAIDWVAKLFFGMAKATVETAKMLADAGQEVKGFSGLLKHFDEGNIGALGAGFQAIAGSLDFTVANFKTLAKQGADFGQNMVAMREAAGAANMPLLQFVDLMQQNTEGFARFFGTTNEGVPVIAAMARSMRDFTENEMTRFGLNFDETNDYMATYLELMRSQGRAENMNTQQLITGSQAYVKQLVRLSRLTGQSTDELNRSMEQQKQNGVLQAALAKRAPEEARRLGELVESLGGATSAYGGLAVDMIAAGAPMTEVSRKLAGANSDILNIISTAINDPSTDISATISNVRKASNQFLKDFPQAAAYFQGEFITILDAAATAAGKKVGEKILPEKTWQTAQQKFTEAAVGWQETVDKAKKSVEAVSLAMYQLVATDGGGAIKEFEKILLGVTGKAEEYVKKGTEMLGGSNFSFDTASKALKVYVVNMWNKVKEFAQNTKLGTEDGPEYLDDESIFGNIRRGGQRLGEGEDSVYDILTWWDTKAEKEKKRLMKMHQEHLMKQYQGGTHGFQNFGGGTPVMLHGMEAVVPKNDFGQALEVFKESLAAGNPISDAAKTYNLKTGDTHAGGSSGNAELISGVERIVTTNEKVANALNKLITIGAMTERNTKNTNNNLANLSGSLV